MRYLIYDCAIIIDTYTDFPSVVSHISTLHMTIKFEMERPDHHGFLP